AGADAESPIAWADPEKSAAVPRASTSQTASAAVRSAVGVRRSRDGLRTAQLPTTRLRRVGVTATAPWSSLAIAWRSYAAFGREVVSRDAVYGGRVAVEIFIHFPVPAEACWNSTETIFRPRI